MKVEMQDSFLESLEKLVWYDSKLFKVWEFFRRDIPNFVRNVWRFRKELRDHYWWDYRYTLEMLYRSLTIMEKGLRENGHEVDESRNPKLKSIQRALTLLKNKMDDNYIGRAEAELGELAHHPWEFRELENGNYELVDNDTPEEKEHARKVFARARELEDSEWKELWEIFKGTKYSKMYGKKYDGTDMRAWWD